MNQEIMQLVSGEKPPFQRAILPGFARRKVRGEVYPAVVKMEGASVRSIMYQNLSAKAFVRLDRFEGPSCLRTGVSLLCEDGKEMDAYTYVYPPALIHQLANEDWSYEDFLKEGKLVFRKHYEGFKTLDWDASNRISVIPTSPQPTPPN